MAIEIFEAHPGQANHTKFQKLFPNQTGGSSDGSVERVECDEPLEKAHLVKCLCNCAQTIGTEDQDRDVRFIGQSGTHAVSDKIIRYPA